MSTPSVAVLGDSGPAAEPITEVRRKEALLKTGALQNAILNSATFSLIATDGLCNRHAGLGGRCGELEYRSGADQGLPRGGNRRSALLPLLPSAGHRARCAAA